MKKAERRRGPTAPRLPGTRGSESTGHSNSTASQAISACAPSQVGRTDTAGAAARRPKAECPPSQAHACRQGLATPGFVLHRHPPTLPAFPHPVPGHPNPVYAPSFATSDREAPKNARTTCTTRANNQASGGAPAGTEPRSGFPCSTPCHASKDSPYHHAFSQGVCRGRAGAAGTPRWGGWAGCRLPVGPARVQVPGTGAAHLTPLSCAPARQRAAITWLRRHYCGCGPRLSLAGRGPTPACALLAGYQSVPCASSDPLLVLEAARAPR